SAPNPSSPEIWSSSSEVGTGPMATLSPYTVSSRAASGQPAEGVRKRRPAPWLFYLIAIYALTGVYLLAHFVGPAFLNSGAVYNVLGGSTVLALIVGARR